MQDLQLGLVQHTIVPENPEANLAAYEKVFAGLGGCDLVLLPEVFTTGFSARARHYAEAPNGPTHDWLARWAAELDAVVSGSLVVCEGGNYFNRLIWMTPDGRYQQYDKRHLFRMAGEHKRYSSGTQRPIFECRGWRVLPQVCYDLRFPVWSRNRGDYDLAFYVANWPAARAEHWKALLRARAIENLSYVVGVNRIGEDEHGQHYAGDSVVHGPQGETLVQAADRAGGFVTTLSARALHDYRQAFPAHLDADDFHVDP